MARNLLNLEEVSKAFDIRALLERVSLGISEGDRIGIVGRNGSGKSTLMKIMSAAETPDSGRVTKSNDTRIGLLSQVDNAPAGATVRDVVLGNKPTHEWASDSGIREVFTGLFGGFDDHLFERTFATLSGGERRRVGLAKLLIDDLDLVLLDEPTNHLDVEGVAWLANHLLARKSLALAVITHDRWFLDAVTERTWEVVGGKVEEYDGGYSAFVLAKAERARQASAMDARRNNLIRKELAWLRRGAPARTTKPKFRVDAANELISAEPAPRDQGELLKFARNRLGNTVYESHHVQLRAGDKLLLDDLYWNIGPGDRIGIVGINGAGKTTLMRMLTGELQPSAGKFVTGVTVKAAFLTQHLLELEDPIFEFNKAIIDATHDLAVSYKPNTAFYEAYGIQGWLSLEKTIRYINDNYPNIFTIADAKRGDIGNTSSMYAKAFFEDMNFDSVTVAPYMGKDSVEPFLAFENKHTIVLALTSNEGAFDFQTLNTNGKELYKQVLETSKAWKNSENLMYVVGATKAEYFTEIRKIVPDSFLLVPGVGAQGGSLHDPRLWHWLAT